MEMKFLLAYLIFQIGLFKIVQSFRVSMKTFSVFSLMSFFCFAQWAFWKCQGVPVCEAAFAWGADPFFSWFRFYLEAVSWSSVVLFVLSFFMFLEVVSLPTRKKKEHFSFIFFMFGNWFLWFSSSFFMQWLGLLWLSLGYGFSIEKFSRWTFWFFALCLWVLGMLFLVFLGKQIGWHDFLSWQNHPMLKMGSLFCMASVFFLAFFSPVLKQPILKETFLAVPFQVFWLQGLLGVFFQAENTFRILGLTSFFAWIFWAIACVFCLKSFLERREKHFWIFWLRAQFGFSVWLLWIGGGKGAMLYWLTQAAVVLMWNQLRSPFSKAVFSKTSWRVFLVCGVLFLLLGKIEFFSVFHKGFYQEGAYLLGGAGFLGFFFSFFSLLAALKLQKVFQKTQISVRGIRVGMSYALFLVVFLIDAFFLKKGFFSRFSFLKSSLRDSQALLQGAYGGVLWWWGGSAFIVFVSFFFLRKAIGKRILFFHEKKASSFLIKLQEGFVFCFQKIFIAHAVSFEKTALFKKAQYVYTWIQKKGIFFEKTSFFLQESSFIFLKKLHSLLEKVFFFCLLEKGSKFFVLSGLGLFFLMFFVSFF